MFLSARTTILVALLPILSLMGCTELTTLRERSAVQEKTIKRLRQENSEFQAAYYKIKETLDSENSQSQKSVSQLQRGLDEARNLKSKKEKDLDDQLHTRNLEYDALKSEAADQKAQSEKQIAQLQRDYQALQAERDAALVRIKDLDAKLLAEQANSSNLTKQAAQLKVDLQTAGDHASALQKDVADRDKALQAEKDARATTEKSLAELDKQLSSERQALEVAKAQSAQLKKQLDAASSEAAQKLEQAQKERESLSGEIQTIKSKHAKEMDEAKSRVVSRPARDGAPPAGDPELSQAASQLKDRLKSISSARGAQVRVDRRGLRIIIPSSALFDENATVLADRSSKVLSTVAQALKKMPGRSVHVEGHTDNQIIQDMPFADNWNLGFARADRVRDFLMKDGGISGDRLTALSRAQFEPLASNDSAEGRAQNRRVEIVVGEKSGD